MLKHQWKLFEVNMFNIVCNMLGATGQINALTGSVASSLGNAMGICLEAVLEAKRTGIPVNKATVANKFKVLGPFLGLTENEFVNLAVAVGLVGLSSVGLMGAAASGPVGIFLAAVALLGDAIGLGASAHGLQNRVNEALSKRPVITANARRIQMLLEAEYKKEQGRAPSLGRPVLR